MRITSLCATLSVTFLMHTYGDDLSEILNFPRGITINEQHYSFNQEALEKTLDYNSKALAKSQKSDLSNNDSHKNDELLTHLAYGLISAAYFADMTPQMSDILERIQTDLANLPVPSGILPPDALFMGIASQSFIDSDGQPPDISTSSLGPGRFAMLAGFTREKIQNRNKRNGVSTQQPE